MEIVSMVIISAGILFILILGLIAYFDDKKFKREQEAKNKVTIKKMENIDLDASFEAWKQRKFLDYGN